MIKLFPHNATTFESLGVGCLDDEILSISITEELNGIFEGEFRYPIDGRHFDAIKDRALICCKANPYDPPTVFRIYNVSTPIDRTVTVSMNHISYDLSGFPVDVFDSKSARGALLKLKQKALVEHPFTFSTDIPDPEDPENAPELLLELPKTTRSVLGEEMTNTFGGEYKFGIYDIELLKNRGRDRKVKMSYGKNIKDMNQDRDCTEVYTEVLPFWKGEVPIPTPEPLPDDYIEETETKIIFSDPLTFPVPGDHKFKRIMIYDLSSLTDVAPTQEAITEFTEAYIENNSLASPKVSITASYADIYSAEGYPELEVLQEVRLGDFVTIEFDDAYINTVTKCIKTVYDPLLDEYTSTEFGDVSSSLDVGINDIVNSIEKEEAELIKNFEKAKQEAIDEATNIINQGLGGYVFKTRDELLIMDTPSPLTCKNLWRWNIGGLAFSSNGYSGPYTTAITNNGKLVLNEITVDEITANLIKGGSITSVKESGEKGNVKMNLEEDFFEVVHEDIGTKTRMDASGLYILDSDGEKIAELAATDTWSTLKADRVFAGNIDTIYQGISNLYVNTDATTVGDGSYHKPFPSLQQCFEYLNATKIINKKVSISISGSRVIYDDVVIENFKGSGMFYIVYDKTFEHHAEGYPLLIKNNSIVISIGGGRTSYSSNDGAVLISHMKKNSYYPGVIEVINCHMVYIYSLNVDGLNSAINVKNSRVLLYHLDFMDCTKGVWSLYSAMVTCRDCVGNCTKFCFDVDYGGHILYGHGKVPGYTPLGPDYHGNGFINNRGGTTPTPSFRRKPPVPPTKTYTQSFGAHSLATYQYGWSSWKGGIAKQGRYSSYGNKAGHFFFDLTAIRNFIGNGTVLSGCSIQITRDRTSGNSSATSLYINGSTASGASGTPSYVHNQWLGSLAWGQTSSFDLSTNIVNALRNSSANSIAFYSSQNSSAYVALTSATITIRVEK